MNENCSNNCKEMNEELYNLIANIIYKKNFSLLGELNKLMEGIEFKNNEEIFLILLSYIYYILLLPGERKLVFNIKNYILSYLVTANNFFEMGYKARIEEYSDNYTTEDTYMDEFAKLILNKYNKEWKHDIDLETYDYNKIHKFIEYVYKTRFSKFTDIFIILSLMWIGMYSEDSHFLSDYDKDLLDIITYSVMTRIPNPYDKNFVSNAEQDFNTKYEDLFDKINYI